MIQKISILHPFTLISSHRIASHPIFLYIIPFSECEREKEGKNGKENTSNDFDFFFHDNLKLQILRAFCLRFIKEISAMCSFSSIYSGFNCAFSLALSLYSESHSWLEILLCMHTRVDFFRSLSFSDLFNLNTHFSSSCILLFHYHF